MLHFIRQEKGRFLLRIQRKCSRFLIVKVRLIFKIEMLVLGLSCGRELYGACLANLSTEFACSAPKFYVRIRN